MGFGGSKHRVQVSELWTDAEVNVKGDYPAPPPFGVTADVRKSGKWPKQSSGHLHVMLQPDLITTTYKGIAFGLKKESGNVAIGRIGLSARPTQHSRT